MKALICMNLEQGFLFLILLSLFLLLSELLFIGVEPEPYRSSWSEISTHWAMPSHYIQRFLLQLLLLWEYPPFGGKGYSHS